MLPQQNIPSTANSSLSFGGTSTYSIKGDRVFIEVGEIANARENGFLSGTLSIELWALPEAYDGGSFSGFPLAFTTIGELSSQHFLSNCQYDLNYTQPPQGKWHFTLMLREWDGHAYITRDHVNFQHPYQQGNVSKDLQAEEKKSNVIRLAYTSANEVHTEEQTKKLEKTAKKAKVSKKEVNKTAGLLSTINASSLEDLASIKGIYKKLAETIKAAQPFNELNDLLKIKGLGKKKFEAICNHFAK